MLEFFQFCVYNQLFRLAFLNVRPHCANARWNRWQDLNSFPVELEETTGMLSYYVDEDYLAGHEIE